MMRSISERVKGMQTEAERLRLKTGVHQQKQTQAVMHEQALQAAPSSQVQAQMMSKLLGEALGESAPKQGKAVPKKMVDNL